MSVIDSAEIVSAMRSSGFGDTCVKFSRDVKFQEWEVTYKRRLASFIRSARDAVLATRPNWSLLLRAAFTRSENNLVNWRVSDPFLKWCEQRSTRARHILSRLWQNSVQTRERFRLFTAEMEREGFKQPGMQLCVGSVLLMASESDMPPMRMQVLRSAIDRLGLELPKRLNAADAYDTFLELLDELIAFSKSYPHPLRNRLEAQGAVWCGIGGWKNSSEIISPERCVADLDEASETEILAAEPELVSLERTERDALIKARIGQGTYRAGLMTLWHGTCAVTSCAREELLIASHLKPWRTSSNAERLDVFNGLLLLPHFDAALDHCLISFTDEGKMMISRTLRHEESRAMGLTAGARLQFVHPKHKKYLAQHRSLFRQREREFGLR